MVEATHLVSVGAELGEGPIWIGDALWFVDIKGKAVFRHTPATDALDRWDAPEFVGWVLPAIDGALIAGLESGPHRFSPETGEFARIVEVDLEYPANRLNDAAVHPSGRVYFGTMDNDEAQASGRVFMLHDGVLTPTSIAPAVVTNGPAISPDGRTLYHVDTFARRLTAHSVADDGSLGEGRTFVAFTGDEGYPDGAICDVEGGVWIGFYGGWAARRYDASGAMTDEVRFPVANVTKVALGGPDGRTAYATSARQGLSSAALAAQPLAGDVFTFPVTIGATPVTLADCRA